VLVCFLFACQNTAVQACIHLQRSCSPYHQGSKQGSQARKGTFNGTVEGLLVREARSFGFFNINVIFFLAVVVLTALFLLQRRQSYERLL